MPAYLHADEGEVSPDDGVQVVEEVGLTQSVLCLGHITKLKWTGKAVATASGDMLSYWADNCTLIVPLCSISYMANCPIFSDIGRLDEQAIYNHGWCVRYKINFSYNG